MAANLWEEDHSQARRPRFGAGFCESFSAFEVSLGAADALHGVPLLFPAIAGDFPVLDLVCLASTEDAGSYSADDHLAVHCELSEHLRTLSLPRW